MWKLNKKAQSGKGTKDEKKAQRHKVAKAQSFLGEGSRLILLCAFVP